MITRVEKDLYGNTQFWVEDVRPDCARCYLHLYGCLGVNSEGIGTVDLEARDVKLALEKDPKVCEVLREVRG